jgi:hypothetical protein
MTMQKTILTIMAVIGVNVIAFGLMFKLIEDAAEADQINFKVQLLSFINISQQTELGLLFYKETEKLDVLTNDNVYKELINKEYFKSSPKSPFKDSVITFNKDLNKIYVSNISVDSYLNNVTLIKENNVGYENNKLFYILN